MRVFISGGCKNGKSFIAQRIAKAQQKDRLYYVATMKPHDNEDSERIIRHKNEREGWGFITAEQPYDIEKVLESCDPCGSFLLDSTTALLAGEMFRSGGVNMDAAEKIKSGLAEIFGCVGDIAVVSDYIFGDAEIYDSFSEHYRKSLADIDSFCAQRCDIVIEVAFTSVIVHKGKDLYEKLR